MRSVDLLRHGPIAALAAALLLLPFAARVPLVIVALAALGVLVCDWWVARQASDEGVPRGSRSGALLLQLSPVLLLTAAYPLASPRLAGGSIDGVELPAILLASSLTIPWLAQSLCLPLYRGIGEEVWRGDLGAARARFLRIWPTTALISLPVIALFAVGVEVATGWVGGALGAYVLLCMLNGVFSQALVIVNVAKARTWWAAAWAVYATALLAAPTAWWLPPLLATFVPLVYLRRELPQLFSPQWGVARRTIASDAARGLLTGTVLWADKAFVFVHHGTTFPVQTVFLALMPAVIVYNYYFVRMSVPFEHGVGQLRRAMEDAGPAELDASVRRAASSVVMGLERAALLSSALSVFVVAVLAVSGADATLASVVAASSVLFLVMALASYKLEYLGLTGVPQVVGGAHLLACAVTFALVSDVAHAYLVLAGVDLVLLAVVVRSAVLHWRTPEHSLFWRHAVTW